jgi:predicted dehydrogenase
MLQLMVVGCGAVVEGLYRDPLKTLESRGIARVAVLVDPNPERIAALRRTFPGARGFATSREAFADHHPDLTIVASPPGRHAEHAVEAFDAGSHVLCEKPMAVSVSDAERMVGAAGRARRVLAVGMVRRMFPCLSEARVLIDSGVLGEDLRFIYREGAVYSWPVSTDAAFRRATAGGGVLTDIGTHVVDFLAALFGAPRVSSFADDGRAEGVETNCEIELVFPRASGTVRLSWSQPLVSGLHITGSVGELTLDPARLDALRWRRHGGTWETRASNVAWPTDLQPAGTRTVPRDYVDCIYHQLVQALRAVVHGDPVAAGGAAGLAAVRTIRACYEQATPLRMPWLDPAEQARADAHHWKGERWVA